MAESFLTSIGERVLEKIIDFSVREVGLPLNVKSELRKLEGKMSNIKDVLLDAEQHQHRNEELQSCIWKLRNIFYDAEDVLDDFRCEALRKQVVNHPKFSFKVRFLAPCSFPLAFSSKIGHKIKEINQRFDELGPEWDSFNLRPVTDNRRVRHRVVHSLVDSSYVIGREADKENIIDLLMKPSEDRNIPVIPVVGSGGLGKTTLVQLIYNDDRVTRSFPLKIWICVSDEFDLPRLLKQIIQSINIEERCDEALQTHLRSLLKDKKFLLVLDDVWNEDQARWIMLRDLLRSMGGLTQSKIIVTTRSLKVAAIMSPLPPYELKGLRPEDCLTLFAKWAFNDGDERQHPNLMRIGEEIVKKCKGVPLAVRTLGSLLFLKTDESDWVSIRDSEIWRLEHQYNILSALKLSYNHLPSHLQRCLAFLSLFEKDNVYHSRNVIRLWMANGLLEHPKEKQEWEDVGHQYLNELLSRCLIQKEEDCVFGAFTFRMPDLIHDLALYVSQKERTVDKDVRHLSFVDDKLLEVPQAMKKLRNAPRETAKTYLTEGKEGISILWPLFKLLRHFQRILTYIFNNFKRLRVLDFEGAELYMEGEFLRDIDKLTRLRYLSLKSTTCVSRLPSSIGNLRLMQTLDLQMNEEFPVNIPDVICKHGNVNIFISACGV